MSDPHKLALPQKSGDHSVTFQLETQTREELFGLGIVLADILPLSLIQDSKQPVLISVNGDEYSGKKIIPDSARDHLLGFNSRMIGNREFDERWFGRYKKQSIEINFMNAAWDFGYSKALNEAGNEIEMINRLCMGRKYPGISFIHNCSNDFKAAADIDIEIKIPGLSESGLILYSPETDEASAKAYRLAEIAADEAAVKSWKRSLELRINDTRLLSRPNFMEACESLSDRIASAHPGILKRARNMVTRSVDDARRNLILLKYDIKKSILFPYG